MIPKFALVILLLMRLLNTNTLGACDFITKEVYSALVILYYYDEYVAKE
jgi:hypothetical protein